MVTKKKPATRWYDGTTPIEDLAANEQLAHEMVSRYRDLAPVRRADHGSRLD